MKEDPPEYQKPGAFMGFDVDVTRHDIISFLEHALVGPDISNLKMPPEALLDYRYRCLQQQVLAVLYKMREPDRKRVGRIDLGDDS